MILIRLVMAGHAHHPVLPHEYVIIVLALNRELPPSNESDFDLIRSIAVGDIVGYGVLIGYYGG